MPTIGSITKTIRINPKDLEVIESLMADGTSWSGAIHKLCEGTPINTAEIPKKDEKAEKSSTSKRVYPKELEELLSYAPLFRMTEEEYVSKLKEAIDNGVLMEENGKFIGVCQYDMSVLEEKCKQSGMSVQGVIDKMTKMIGG